jgi:predicted nucleic acid-binding protein
VRAVVDTNILVSGLLGTSSPPSEVVMAIATDRIRPVVCAEIVAEYRDVLARPRLHIRPDRAAELLKLIEQTADWVTVPTCRRRPTPTTGPSSRPHAWRRARWSRGTCGTSRPTWGCG